MLCFKWVKLFNHPKQQIISNRRRVQSFVYDLNLEQGTVSMRVASVPRSTEV